MASLCCICYVKILVPAQCKYKGSSLTNREIGKSKKSVKLLTIAASTKLPQTGMSASHKCFFVKIIKDQGSNQFMS